MKCPICNEDYQDVNSHLIKSKNTKHREYMLMVNKKILELFGSGFNFSEISKQTNNMSHSYISRFCKKNFSNYKEITNNNKKISVKRKRNRRMFWEFEKNIETVDVVRNMFYLDKSIVEIAKQNNISDRTVNRIFELYFSIEEIRKRGVLHQRNSRPVVRKYREKMTNQKLINNIIELFDSDMTAKEIAKKFNITNKNVIDVWTFNGLDTKARRIKLRLKKIIKNYKIKQKERPNKVDKKIIKCYMDELDYTQIAKKLNIKTNGGKWNKDLVREVFNKFLSYNEKKERQKINNKIRYYRTISGTKNTMICGSKVELYLFDQLKKYFFNTKHHEESAVPYRQYDISIEYNGQKYLIEVQGPHHYKPIYGKEKFRRTIMSDKTKKTAALNKGYGYIIIKFVGNLKNKSSQNYLQKKAKQLAEIIKNNKNNKLNIEI